jgi:hypothetical protein
VAPGKYVLSCTGRGQPARRAKANVEVRPGAASEVTMKLFLGGR